MRKIKPISSRARSQAVKTGPAHIDINDFEQFALGAETVEHVSVPGFMARIAHGWALDDMTRFGDKVGRVADAMQLVFITTNQTKLGIIRVFPLPLLQRVYEILSPQFGWPRIIDAGALPIEDGRQALRDELQKAERSLADLSSIAEHTDNVDALQSIQEVRDFLTGKIAELRAAV
jgi:hypothetical protein